MTNEDATVLTETSLAERHSDPRSGVTLIEMLVVVTIIALFAAIVGPRLLHRGDQARAVAAKQQISDLELALGQYKLDTGTFPTTEQGLAAPRQQHGRVGHDAAPGQKVVLGDPEAGEAQLLRQLHLFQQLLVEVGHRPVRVRVIGRQHVGVELQWPLLKPARRSATIARTRQNAQQLTPQILGSAAPG